MEVIVKLVPISLINAFSVSIWAISGFGNGIIYQISWQICSRINEGICNGSVSDAVEHITMAATLIFPIQVCYLFRFIDWKLVLHLYLGQTIGAVIGLYALVTADTTITARFFGFLMGIAALQRASSEYFTNQDGASDSKRDNSQIAYTQLPTQIESKDSLQGDAANVIPKTVDMPWLTYSFVTIKDYVFVWSIGLTAGIFGGLYGVGGPPLMYFVAATNMDKNACRASITALYLFENIERGVFMYIMGRSSSYPSKFLNPDSMYFKFLLVALNVSAVVGLIVGNAVISYVDQAMFRKIILIILTLGSFLLGTNKCTPVESAIVSIALIVFYVLGYWFMRRMNTVRGANQLQIGTNSMEDIEGRQNIEMK